MKSMLMILLLLIMLGSGYGQCPSSNTTFLKNKRILLDMLIKNTPLHDGFYNASVGNNSDQVYGVSQCKANVSSIVCADCLKSSIGPSDQCPEFQLAESISSFCTTKISETKVYGVWNNSSTAGYGDQGLDDPLVFSKGFSMMQNLANTVPYQPLMLQRAEIDIGVDGKRYGLAQCGRDLSMLTCQNCLEDRLQRYRSFVENRPEWEVLGSSCCMWYSNISDTYKKPNTSVVGISPSVLPSDENVPPPSVTSGAQRGHGGIVIETSIWITTFTILLFASQVFHLS